MAVWADLDADDDIPASTCQIVTPADQSNADVAEEHDPHTYISHALRCYPYAHDVSKPAYEC